MINPDRIILDHEINDSKKLIIEVNLNFLKLDVEGDLFRKKLSIDASGLDGSLRNSRDGVTYFGFKNNNKNVKILFSKIKEYSILNDFIINHQNDSDSKSVFSITYQRGIIFYDNLATQEYFLKSIYEKKSGKNLIYSKIEFPLKISEKRFYFIGDCLFFVEPDESKYF